MTTVKHKRKHILEIADNYTVPAWPVEWFALVCDKGTAVNEGLRRAATGNGRRLRGLCLITEQEDWNHSTSVRCVLTSVGSGMVSILM